MIILMLSFGLFGCGSSEAPKEEQRPEEVAEKVPVIFDVKSVAEKSREEVAKILGEPIEIGEKTNDYANGIMVSFEGDSANRIFVELESYDIKFRPDMEVFFADDVLEYFNLSLWTEVWIMNENTIVIDEKGGFNRILISHDEERATRINFIVKGDS